MADNLSEVPVENGRDPRDDVQGPVTIAYIAESAGVSIPTVSKVLNGRSGVSDGTRARIEELINRYGYRKPSGSRNNTVELVFRELESMRAAEIIRGVGRVARRNRMGVMVSELGLHDSPGRTLSEVMDRRPHCVVSVARLPEAERDQLSGKGIPFVVFDPATELPDDVPFVGTTNWRGGRSATRHLIELGHRRIAMIGGPKDMPCLRARLAGHGSALEGAGLPVDPSLIIHSPLTRADGCAAARRLLTRPDRPTAVFAANDLQALGVYKAARELALRIPDDVSVVGFGDLPVVAWADPPMTTVHQPLTEMAMAATELALALGRGEEPAQVGLEIATTLTVRSSTAPPAE
ncbi:LacI family DNA-binding transcriptional regulator [Sphaerimonospora sp. CA-214678]|uniref:LacI family DNA-binding transcriptional regulator n=1 Tax=Sphaerimonospora sp. CA-214678 TaxID=3240029 RepID=UPI003D8B0505